MLERLPAALAFWLIVLVAALPAFAGETPSETYERAGDFKAVAGSGAIRGYAWDYDTPAGAARAARAHCRIALPEGYGDRQCRVLWLGDEKLEDPAGLDEALERYQERVLDALRADLARTGERELVTRLSTILQKIGRYAESEALLYGLAMGGEHLAQNALAYHWAELKKRLPEALALADSAVARDPEFFSYHDTRGLVLARLGRLPEALAEMKKAVKLKAHPIALDHYGDALWLSGQKDAAREQWRRAAKASVDILFIERVQAKAQGGLNGDFVFE